MERPGLVLVLDEEEVVVARSTRVHVVSGKISKNEIGLTLSHSLQFSIKKNVYFTLIRKLNLVQWVINIFFLIETPGMT